MKLSNRKKEQIAAVIHDLVTGTRIQVQHEFSGHKQQDPSRYIDYHIAQLEIPLAQAFIKVVEKKKSP